jgi:cytochrome c-type biogenesis protein CcmH/NrfG
MLEPRPAGHLALAQTCIHLREYDLAAQALEAVQRLAPGIPQIAELTALLETKRSGGHSK